MACDGGFALIHAGFSVIATTVRRTRSLLSGKEIPSLKRAVLPPPPCGHYVRTRDFVVVFGCGRMADPSGTAAFCGPRRFVGGRRSFCSPDSSGSSWRVNGAPAGVGFRASRVAVSSRDDDDRNNNNNMFPSRQRRTIVTVDTGGVIYYVKPTVHCGPEHFLSVLRASGPSRSRYRTERNGRA